MKPERTKEETKVLPVEIENIVKEVVQVCKAHTDENHFDHEGAEANALSIVGQMLARQKKTNKRTKEEIIADVLGWESFSPGPVMADTDDFLKAMEEYRQSSPVEKWVSFKKRIPEDDMLVVCAKWYAPWGRFVREECMTWKEMKGCRDYDIKHEWTHWIQIPELPPIEEPKEK